MKSPTTLPMPRPSLRASSLPLPSPAGAFLCLGLALAACSTPPSEDASADLTVTGAEGAAGTQPAAAPAVAVDEPRAAEAIAHIEDGDYEAARELLSDLLFEEYMTTARAELSAGAPEDGLLWIDRARDLRPRDADARLLDARGRLMLAEKGMAEGAPGVIVEGALVDALEGFQACTGSIEAAFGASRAARLLGRPAEALTFARAGMDALEGATGDPGFEPAPERTLAEAAYGAYVDARRRLETGETTAADVQELYLMTEDALARLVGRAGDDPWVHDTLAYLYEWEGRYDDAISTLERGLDRLPRSDRLMRHLAAVARRVGGLEGSLTVFEGVRRRHPDVALAHWYEAYERFHLALQRLDAGAPDPEAFRVAEAGFRTCRELDDAHADTCLGYEVVCRSGTGWAHFQQDALGEAIETFLSMEDLRPRGMEWNFEGRLGSGVDGLAWCANKYVEREDWLSAAELFDRLRLYVPGDGNWSNNAGFLFRDAAVEMEFVGRRFCRAARGELTSEETLADMRASLELGEEAPPGSDAERAAFAKASNQLMARAREVMIQSRDAYLDAAGDLPDDVRVVNDTALVLVYYLHEDLDLAEEYLLRAVALGEAQLADPDLDEEARYNLLNAWGDAHQNLGVLHASHRGDEATARRYFERAVEIGPDPRVEITERWFPILDGDGAGDFDDAQAVTAWAEPCAP